VSEPVELHARSRSRTMAIAARLAEGLAGGDLVALRGPLGAGKTAFVRGLASGLGIDTRLVSSPTFVLVQEYPVASSLPPGRPEWLVHVDAYRMETLGDLETIGWEDLTRDERVVVALEWPQRVEAALPATRLEVEIRHGEPHERHLASRPTGPEAPERWHAALRDLVEAEDALGPDEDEAAGEEDTP